MASPYLVSVMLDALRDEGYLPADGDATSTRLLGVINREQRLYLTKLMLSVREDYLLTSVDVALTAGQTTVRVPSRAIGAALKLVSFVSDDADPVIVYPTSSELSSTDLSGASYSMQGNSIVLNAPATASTMRISYFRRMNKIVTAEEAGEISAINTGAKTVTLAGVTPTLFLTTATSYDFVQGTPHFDTLASDESATLSGQVLTFTNALPDGLVVGDYVALAGQTPICQAPLELHDILAFRACVKHLTSRGDPKLAGMIEDLKAMRDDALSLLQPRVQGSAKVLINPNAPGWNRGFARRRWR